MWKFISVSDSARENSWNARKAYSKLSYITIKHTNDMSNGTGPGVFRTHRYARLLTGPALDAGSSYEATIQALRLIGIKIKTRMGKGWKQE
jgi:hypothetical protein